MIDTEAFVRNSPFKLTHNDSSDRYNLNNTTPDLLKFQLQEQYRSTMSELHKDALIPLNIIWMIMIMIILLLPI